MDFRSLPKMELHLHLDCSLSFALIHQLDPTVTRDRFETEFAFKGRCDDLADFLARIPGTLALMQQASQLRAAVFDLMAQLAADGVIYAEIRFAPLLHTEAGMSAHEVVAVVTRALKEATGVHGVEARLILCTLRHFSQEMGMETARLVDAFREHGVVGLDLAADEAGFPIEPHVRAFEFAAERGLCRTAHAGEACGPESVRETLARLRPQRIGHGVRAIEDPDLVGKLAEDGTHLEVCPSCNVQIGVFPSAEAHPIDRLYRAGVPLSVNTDGRTIPLLTLTGEYAMLHRVFGWGPAEFYACNRNALNAAFLPESSRANLLRRLEAGYHSRL